MKKTITIAIMLLSIVVNAQLKNERVVINVKAPLSERIEPIPFYEPEGYYYFNEKKYNRIYKEVFPADTCYKVVEILAFTMGPRSTLAEYKYLCRDTVTNEKYVITLVNNWEKEGKPNTAPTGPLCIKSGVLYSNGKKFIVTSIK